MKHRSSNNNDLMTEADIRLVASSVFNHSNHGIVITNANQEIINVNDAFIKNTGYERNEVIDKKTSILKSGIHNEIFYQEMWQKINVDGFWEGDIWNKKKDGTFFLQHLSITTIKDQSENVSHYIGMAYDVTKLFETEQKLLKTNKSLKALVKSSPVGIVFLDQQQTIQVWNDACVALFKKSENECLHKKFADIIVDQNNLINKILNDIYMNQKNVREIDISIEVEASVKHFRLSTSPLLNGDLLEGLILVFYDQTRKKNLEDEKTNQLAFAKAVQKSVLSKPLKNKEIDLNGFFLPSEELSGDMYAFFEIAPNKYGAMVIDVMGHGVASALISMSIRSLLRGLITRVVEPLQVIEELKKHLKNMLLEDVLETSFQFSVMYVVIHTKKQEIEYVNAGHPPAILAQEKNSTVELLDKGGMAIGSPFDVPFQKGKIKYEAPANLILYSDGILDAISTNILESLNELEKVALTSTSSTSDTIISTIKNYIAPTTRYPDDICIVAIHLPKTS